MFKEYERTMATQRSDSPVESYPQPRNRSGSSFSLDSLTASAASFATRSKRNLGIAKQWTLQKAGRATPTPDSPEFLRCLENLKQLNESVMHLQKVTRSVYAIYPESPNPTRQFINTELKQYGVLLADYRTAKLECDYRSSEVDKCVLGEKKPSVLAEAKALRDEAVVQLGNIRRDLQNLEQTLSAQRDELYARFQEDACGLINNTLPTWNGGVIKPAPSIMASVSSGVSSVNIGIGSKDKDKDASLSDSGDGESAGSGGGGSESKGDSGNGKGGKGGGKKKGKKGGAKKLELDESVL